MSIEQISGRIIDGLLIITFLTALTLVVLAGRRRHITIANVSNGTGHAELNDSMIDMSVHFRLAVGAQLERVREMVLGYHRKVQNASDRCYGLQFPEMNNALIADQNSTLASLLASLNEGPARGMSAQLQALGQLVVRSRGATVTAIFHGRDQDHSSLGITVEIVSQSSRFTKCRLLWEADGAVAQGTLSDRIDALIQPAARCAAIDLAAWVLQQPMKFPARGGRRRRQGLALNMVGQLWMASAVTFSPFAKQFLQFALDEFMAATEKLPSDYQPHFNLAAVREAEGEGAADYHTRYTHFMSAVNEYRAAIRAAGRLPRPARSTIQRTIKVRLARAELISNIARLRHDALNWLREERLKVELDCHIARSRPHWPIRAMRPVHDRVILDGLTADSLYNSACMYAIASRDAKRGDWDQHARRLLGTALVVGAAEGDLWKQAKRDSDLKQLSWHLPEFLNVLREALPDYPVEEVPLPEIVKLVDDASIAAHWHAIP